MTKFYIFTVSLLAFLLIVLYVMNKVWKRYSLEELLKRNDPEFYKVLCSIAEKHSLTPSGLTIIHYCLVKDSDDKLASAKVACDNFLNFFEAHYKDRRKGAMETCVQNSLDFGHIVDVLQQENLIESKFKIKDFSNLFNEEDLGLPRAVSQE
ncbi:MAG: hypothetical protein NE334_18750 [Lentisphaeraceae bacterium]|nr:hypothetical protein [Lentisphaeraceae bacterium]